MQLYRTLKTALCFVTHTTNMTLPSLEFLLGMLLGKKNVLPAFGIISYRETGGKSDDVSIWDKLILITIN